MHQSTAHKSVRQVFLKHLFCLVGLAIVMIAGPAQAEKRVAFVVGNSEYQFFGSLRNPTNDADDMSVALQGLGFDVIRGTDLTKDGFLEQLENFRQEIQDADVSLFFFAGHGFQANSRNFLLPADANGRFTNEVLATTVDLNTVLTVLDESPGLKIVFIDACRDNPLGIDGGLQGLAQVGSQQGYLISYATQPNAVAYDGQTRNSYFTDALLYHLATPGQNITDLMISVRREVIAVTGGLQIPWDSSSLTRQFQFRPGSVVQRQETELFRLAAGLGSSSLARYYTQRFPRGAHIREAELIVENPNALTRSMLLRKRVWRPG